MQIGPCIGRGSPAVLAVAALLLAGAALLLGTQSVPAQTSRVAEIATYQGRRPRAAADRRRQEGEGAHLLLLDPAGGHCRSRRRLRQEIRRQGQGLACRFRKRPAAHPERGQGAALRGRRHRGCELDARAALSREPAAGGEVALSRRHHSARRSPPHRQWTAIYLNTIVQAYNTNLVQKESLPETYRGSAAAGVEGPARHRGRGLRLVRPGGHRFGARRGARGCGCSATSSPSNGISVRKGHNLLNNLVATGEVPLALTVYGFLAEQTKRKGAPLDWFVIPPAIARPTARRTGAQCAASACGGVVLRFPDRRWPADPGRPPIRRHQPQDRDAVQQIPLKLIDSAMMLDQARKWQDLYQKTISARRGDALRRYAPRSGHPVSRVRALAASRRCPLSTAVTRGTGSLALQDDDSERDLNVAIARVLRLNSQALRKFGGTAMRYIDAFNHFFPKRILRIDAGVAGGTKGSRQTDAGNSCALRHRRAAARGRFISRLHAGHLSWHAGDRPADRPRARAGMGAPRQ